MRARGIRPLNGHSVKCCLVAASLTLLSSLAAAAPVPTILQAIEELQKKHDNIEIVWNKSGNRVKTLRGKLSSPYSGHPSEAARSFLWDTRAVFELAPGLEDLKVESIRSSPAGFHVSFKQMVNSLEVFDGGIEVHMNMNMEVYLAHSYYVPDIRLQKGEELPRKEIVQIAKQELIRNHGFMLDKKGQRISISGLSIEDVVVEEQPVLGIYAGDEKTSLAYRLSIRTSNWESVVELIIEATTGDVLLARDLVATAKGRGQVFDPNPVNTLNDKSLNDQTGGSADANASEFDNAYFKRDLENIQKWLGNFRLNGKYVKVKDNKENPKNFGSSGGWAQSKDERFLYKRGSDRFEHVMVYYHIYSNQKYIQSLGFKSLNNRKVLVDPHGLNGQDQSHYVGTRTGKGHLAFGDGGVDDAEDADIILHEYGHSLQDNAKPRGYSGCTSQAGAMGEGFGDYWAAVNTSTQSQQNGFDAACVGEWDTEGGCLRKVDANRKYPTDFTAGGDCHSNGQIWSRALWDLFKDIGKNKTNKIILQSHYLVPKNPTFKEGGKALLDADKQLFDGQYGCNICAALRDRGIEIDGCGCEDPKTCNSYVSGCNPNNTDCVCYKSAEGDGFCAPGYLCSALTRCSSSANCESGSRCAVETCCPTPVCIPDSCADRAFGKTSVGFEPAATTTGLKPIHE